MEIVNPPGAHVKKHKITVFYFTLCNIPPEFRSQLHAMQLLAIAKTRHKVWSKTFTERFC